MFKELREARHRRSRSDPPRCSSAVNRIALAFVCEPMYSKSNTARSRQDQIVANCLKMIHPIGIVKRCESVLGFESNLLLWPEIVGDRELCSVEARVRCICFLGNSPSRDFLNCRLTEGWTAIAAHGTKTASSGTFHRSLGQCLVSLVSGGKNGIAQGRV